MKKEDIKELKKLLVLINKNLIIVIGLLTKMSKKEEKENLLLEKE